MTFTDHLLPDFPYSISCNWEDKKSPYLGRRDKGELPQQLPHQCEKQRTTLSLPWPTFNKNLPPKPHSGISLSEVARSHFLSVCFLFNKFTVLC